MLTFNYEARNTTTGQKVKATVQADNERAAARLIQEQGLAPLEIKLQNKQKISFFNRVKSKDRILFARQLSTLINAGLPLMQSLRMVLKQTTNKALQVIIGDIISDVESGSNFSDALAKHPMVFGTIFVSLVQAGEASGTLDTSLERLADQQEKDADIVSKVRGALIYPAVVMGVMIAVVVFMLVTVLPQVKVLYDGLPGANLPLLTVVLLAISSFIIKFWYVVVIIIIALVVYFSKWSRTVGGKRYIDKLKMKTPPLNGLFMKMYMARFCRTGSTLISSGVPLLQMMDIVSQSINNVYVEDSIQKAMIEVKGGRSIADALEGDPNFLELVPNMLRIGEQSGSVEEMLSRTADYFEKEVDNQIKAINTIIEPALMIVLGIAALIIVAAVLLPIYGLAGQDLSK